MVHRISKLLPCSHFILGGICRMKAPRPPMGLRRCSFQFSQVTCQNRLVSKQSRHQLPWPNFSSFFLKVTIRKVLKSGLHLESAGSSPARDKAFLVLLVIVIFSSFLRQIRVHFNLPHLAAQSKPLGVRKIDQTPQGDRNVLNQQAAWIAYSRTLANEQSNIPANHSYSS